jgi:hypothetical protein
MKSPAHTVYFLLAAILLSGCSGNLPLFQEMQKGRSDKLDRIEVTPGNITLTDRTFALFAATGYYNDGSTADLTTQCEWSSDDQSVAVISSGGYLQVRKLTGTAHVSARYDSLTSSASVTITIKLVSITVTPSQTTLKSSNQVYLCATGKTSDGTETDLTRTVKWNVTPFRLGSVDVTGLFAASGTSGSVTISAASEDGTVTSNEATVILDLTTLYVDAAFTASAGDGTKEKPFPTINRAISQAKSIGATRINVAKGIYNEDLIIGSDISLYGGYNPDFSGAEWTRDEAVSPADTRIIAKGNIAILFQNGLTAATVLDGFHVEGGNSVLTISTAAIMCSNASPSIQNNELYGGSSLVISYGIMLQTSSASIKNNTISGGLPGYTGGGLDNIAILAQSASNPDLSENTITGPTGGESTYRIKCESSSNAMISNNTIETTTPSVSSAKGIMAISSSPTIENNTITAAASSAISIRGENTSFKVTENSIGGSIYITSGSVNPAIYKNTKIAGNVTVSGASTGVSIRDHITTETADPNYIDHYKKSTTKIIKGSISITGSATGIIRNNAMDNIVINDGATSTITKNIIISESSNPVNINNNGPTTISENYIANLKQSGGYGVTCSNVQNYLRIVNNIIYCSATSAGTEITGIGASSINWYILIANNMIAVDSASADMIYVTGCNFGNYTYGYHIRLYNNIIKLKGGTIRRGIYNNVTTLPGILLSNYFNNCTFFFSGTQSCTDITTLNDLATTSYDLNASFADNTGHYFYDFVSTRFGADFIRNDFHISDSSPFHNAGKNPGDLSSSINASDAEYINIDFDSKPRTVTTNQFSVGPYEYVAP